MRRLGVDTGGTFTDAVLEEEGVLKLPSLPENPARVIGEVRQRLVPEGGVDLRHGTTVCTNALLEAKLAPVGVLVNRGFRDLLLIGRQARPGLYALEPRQPWLPTRPDLCREIPGRIGPGGEELEAFDEEACHQVGRQLIERGAAALAVVLLHSYARPGHERRARRVLSSLGVPVTLSSDLNPEFREVERGVACVVNAGLIPPAGRYLASLKTVLGPQVQVRVMTSEGGLLTTKEAAGHPARLLVSGPAGGLVAARVFGAAAGEERLLTLDMGGTSTDVAFLDQELPRLPSLQVAGLEVRLPSLDIHTVGAGGGSLVRLDRGGALTVGPESAGADPGPAAYGRGDELTVTDAHLLLGRLPPEFFAAGPEALDFGHAEACARKLARQAGLSLRDLLTGVLRLANVTMTRALRVISLEKGKDPRGAVLLVFGGAGGLHAVELARSLGIKRVLVPPQPGVLAARGLIWAAPARTLSRTVLCDRLPGAGERKRLLNPLLEELRQRFRRDGMAAKDLQRRCWLDLRYRGQSFELQIPEGGRALERFHQAHQRRFGFRADDRAVELVAVRARLQAREPPPRLPRLRSRRQGKPDPSAPPPSVRRHRSLEFSVFDRQRLLAGDEIAGPALLADHTSTTCLEPGSRALVHPTGTLMIEVGRRP